MLDAMAGSDPVDKYSIPLPNEKFLEALEEKPNKLKIGYSLDLGFVKALDEQVEQCVLSAVKKFEQFEWSVEKVKIKLKKAPLAMAVLVTTPFAFDYKPLLKEWRDSLSPTLVRLIDAGMNVSALDYLKAESQRQNIEQEVYKFFKKFDILITPTTAVPPFELGKMFPEKIAGKSVSPVGWMPFAYPFNMTWNPAASIPCGWTKDGLPIGMQIVGKKWDEKTVLQVSKAFEELSPWQEKRPQFN
jgi:aspartyl-tRNA(Asn)/glutamyl-tRNA(Gln) amidotransferase subunit A